MIFRISFALAALSMAATSQSLAIDFTLRQTNIASEGITLSGSYITDGENKIFLRIPNTWKASDSPASLDLIPEKPGCRVSISQVKTPQTLPLDDAGKAILLKQVTAQLPSGAKNVELLPEVDDLLPINHWTSAEWTYRYEFFGQKVRRSVIYVNMLPGRVIQMSVAAPDALFDGIHEEARVLMSHWFEPRRELSPEMARQYEEGAPHGT